MDSDSGSLRALPYTFLSYEYCGWGSGLALSLGFDQSKPLKPLRSRFTFYTQVLLFKEVKHYSSDGINTRIEYDTWVWETNRIAFRVKRLYSEALLRRFEW